MSRTWPFFLKRPQSQVGVLAVDSFLSACVTMQRTQSLVFFDTDHSRKDNEPQKEERQRSLRAQGEEAQTAGFRRPGSGNNSTVSPSFRRATTIRTYTSSRCMHCKRRRSWELSRYTMDQMIKMHVTRIIRMHVTLIINSFVEGWRMTIWMLRFVWLTSVWKTNVL